MGIERHGTSMLVFRLVAIHALAQVALFYLLVWSPE
jgi:hypothetical protein